MSKCRPIRKRLPAFLLEELEDGERGRVEDHLTVCRECARELRTLRLVMEGAAAYREDVSQAASQVDWDELPRRIASRVFDREARPAENEDAKPARLRLWQPRLRPVYAALMLGVLLGAVTTWMILRGTGGLPGVDESATHISRGFLDNIDVEVARRDTLKYLEQSRYLLLEFVQSSPEASGGYWGSELAASRTRDLLSRKKFINPQLDQYKMAKAKAICDQIEWLFLELTQISGELSEIELQRVRRLIEDRQLLLKINLVEKELKQGEV